MTLRERIGVDLGGKRRLEDGLAWAAAHGVRYVDACLEGAPGHLNAPAKWTAERVAAMRATCERHGIHLGLHSASAVNIAETSPLLADAAEQYLATYLEVAQRLGAAWIVVHGGYHGHYMLAFGSLDDMLAGREHLMTRASMPVS